MNQVSSGLFDKKSSSSMKPDPANQTTSSPIKQDFKSVEQLSSEIKVAPKMSPDKSQDVINKLNNSMGSTDDMKANDEALEELSKISEEDLALAEAMIFNGHAEKTIPIPNFKGRTITVCTTSPEEIDIVEEMLFDLVRDNENKSDNTINISESTVKSSRNMLTLSLAYKGMDSTDIHPDKSCQLSIIKKAIDNLYKYEAAGDIKGMKEMRDSIKSAVKKRSYFVRKLPTPVIDFISQAKYEFDRSMFEIMSSKNLIPKF